MMKSYFKIVKSFEWCTDLPLVGEIRESPFFVIKNKDCYFEFQHIISSGLQPWYFSVFLGIDKDLDFVPFSMYFQVGFKHEPNSSLSLHKGSVRVTPNITDIWRINVKDLHSKLPSDYMMGNWIKFVFNFENIDESLLKIVEGTVCDKCEQTPSYINVDISEESISKDFSKMMDEDLDKDVEIKCGEQSVKVHKIVLCGRSDVFKAMLQSNMRESRSGVVDIQDISACHLQDFIKFMYTDALPEMIFEKAVSLYEAGDKYSIKSLMLRCSEYLQDNLSPENIFQCIVLADAHSDQKLKVKVISYILKQNYYRWEKSSWPLICENFPKIANEVYRLSYLQDSEE